MSHGTGAIPRQATETSPAETWRRWTGRECTTKTAAQHRWRPVEGSSGSQHLPQPRVAGSIPAEGTRGCLVSETSWRDRPVLEDIRDELFTRQELVLFFAHKLGAENTASLREGAMSKVTADISMSLDGSITEPNPGGGEHPLVETARVITQRGATRAEIVDDLRDHASGPAGQADVRCRRWSHGVTLRPLELRKARSIDLPRATHLRSCVPT